MVQTRAQTRQGGPPPPTIQPFSKGIQNNIINKPPRRRHVGLNVTYPEDKVEEPSDEYELAKSEELPHEDKQLHQTEPAPEDKELSPCKAAHNQKHSSASETDKISGGYSVLPAPNIIGVCWALQHVLRGIVYNLTDLELHNLFIAIPPLQPLFEIPNPSRPLAWQD
ncbi:hypothetical protein EPUS_05768 [Endocarpon pusillum Z07020]|uniref:Uncharacterized protein n=1 Tax=Endocarpon pusillum (strain Z07020 / HMAS-L-300199) TaxID=1263415 RepID=U1FV76_ENDPU|nr:uncharacterized protein EPUS_05768 [Endocarpon pusillum Z07020]ERF68707.1 hypothetical protein EPUS_05768 [Endocarpon pusillum Z07020]